MSEEHKLIFTIPWRRMYIAARSLSIEQLHGCTIAPAINILFEDVRGIS